MSEQTKNQGVCVGGHADGQTVSFPGWPLTVAIPYVDSEYSALRAEWFNRHGLTWEAYGHLREEYWPAGLVEPPPFPQDVYDVQKREDGSVVLLLR